AERECCKNRIEALMDIIGLLIVIGLVMFAIWSTVSKLRTYWRIKRHGILIEARITAIKREGRQVASMGWGPTFLPPRTVYEDFLYAQGEDPSTQQTHLFRAKIPDFFDSQVGEPVLFKMNPQNPREYRIQFSSPKSPAKKPLPHFEDTPYQDYQQGYQSSEKGTQAQSDEEQPKAAYPRQLPQQKI